MDGGAWQVTVHGVAKSRTRLSDFTYLLSYLSYYKGQYSQSYGFPSSHVRLWERDNKKGWVLKNWSLWTMVLQKTLESPLDNKKIKTVNDKGNQPWIFTGRTDAKAKAPTLWPPDVKNWLLGKHPDAGKDWRQEEKGITEDKMVGWHNWLDGHDSEQTLGDGERQGSLMCCSPWGHKELDMNEQVNNSPIQWASLMAQW